MSAEKNANYVTNRLNNRSYVIKNNVYLQTWQRICNARSVIWYPCESGCRIRSDMLLSQLLMFTKVEHLEYQTEDEIKILKALMHKCKDKIKVFDVMIDEDYSLYHERLQPLKLSNARTIYLYDMQIPIVWSHRCRELDLYITDGHLIDTKWCNLIINECDCTGIQYLSVDMCHSQMKHKPIIKTDSNYKLHLSALFDKFAQKFTNIKKLEINFGNPNDVLLTLLLHKFQSLITNNNGCIELELDTSKARLNMRTLAYICAYNSATENTQCNYKIIINKLIARFDHRKPEQISKELELQLKLADLAKIEYFQIKHAYGKFRLATFIHQLTQAIFDTNDIKWNSYFGIGNLPAALKLESLKVIDIDNHMIDSDFGFINEFLILMIKIANQRSICIKAHFCVEATNTTSKSMFLWQFEEFCQNVLSLMNKEGALIDIELQILTKSKFDDGYYKEMNQKYLSLFDEKVILVSHKAPKLSKYCQCRETSIIGFKKECLSCMNITFHISNFEMKH